MWHGRVRRAKAAHGNCRDRRPDARVVERTRFSSSHVARHAFLQQQLGRLDSRVGVKTLDHAIAEQDIRQGDQGHQGDGGRDGRPPDG